MPTAENKKLRLAIVGAGIGGLTLSAAIERLKGGRDDLEVDIYEASAQLSEVGAGINFWPRTWEIMQKLGLDQHLLSVLPHVPTSAPRQVFQFRKGDQPEGVYITTAIMEGGSYRFHRADVQRALLNAQTTRLHLSHRLVTYDEKDDEILLQFEGGLTAVCHLLVGMDGIKSTVRKCMLTAQGLKNSSSMHPMWSGDIAYRSLIPVERLEAEYPGHRTITTPMIYAGKSKHLVTYPVSQDKLVNLVAFTAEPSGEGIPYDGPTTLPCSQEEILSNFKLWEPEAQALFKCMEKPTKWVIRFLHPLDSYVSGRVVLGGDAAHAMAPHQGSGAGQAIEDAYVLANLLCDEACTKETVLKVSEIYDKVRRPFGNAILEKSRLTGRIGQFLSPGLEDIVEGDDKVPSERLRAIIQEYIDSLEWVWKESAETDKERALSMLRDLERKTS